MTNKWDDDDVARPAVKPSSTDPRASLDEWQAKLRGAERAGPVVSARPPPPASKTEVEPTPPRTELPAPPVLSAAQAEHLAAEARFAAEQVKARAPSEPAHRRVRLRVNVPGWYPGSVPAVDFCDGSVSFFAHAPSQPLDTSTDYLEYWRAPFVAHLQKLGFEVIEEDL